MCAYEPCLQKLLLTKAGVPLELIVVAKVYSKWSLPVQFPDIHFCAKFFCSQLRKKVIISSQN